MFHCHTDYSLLDSATKTKEYIDLCLRDGSRALSISEHGKPLNWTEKYAACKEAGIKYIHSVEIYLTESLDQKVRDNYHTILMAKNWDGVKEINNLIKMSCDSEHFYYNNRISFEEFLNLSDNIISTSACLASPLSKLEESNPWFLRLANKYTFLEIQPHICPEQAEFNKKLYKLSKELDKPLIVGTDTHSSSEYKARCREILQKAKRKSYENEDKFDLSYKTYDEIIQMFRQQKALPEDVFTQALDNTNLLCDMVDDFELDTSIKYPILYGSREADTEKFDETVESMFEAKLKDGTIPEEQKDAFRVAIDEEMRVFKKLNMTGFMLSMSELVTWCKDNNIAIGTARGSVGGSRVAYVTNITDLNPETWHTVFSRFCNEDREEIGDIDIDCVESDRPVIFNHIIERFGADKTARVASFGKLVDRSIIDEVGRALMYEWNEQRGYNYKAKIKENPYNYDAIEKIKEKFVNDPEATKKEYPEIFYYFDGLQNVRVSQSVHPAGMVISPITLDDNYGVFDKDGEQCLLLDMDNVHDYTGLAKYDFLVLKTVQVIRDTCNYIGIPYPKTCEIDWYDKEVWEEMIKSPTGIFQFESEFAFNSLKKYRPQSIFDMSLVTACIRPSGASYRKTLLAKEPHKNPSELIDKLLENNLGYLVYQEDIIAFLQQVCGLSGSEADNVRRAIGRKQKDRLNKALPDILSGYCAKSEKPRDVSEREAKEFLQIIEDASDYMFGYNHSIAYCLLGYLCAYFRHYYPLEFLTAFLNNAANDDDIKNGTEFAHKIGIKVTMPKWGVSRSDYFFDKERNVIAKGLESVKYIGSGTAQRLYALSKSRRYDYFVDLIDDLRKEASINVRDLDVLIKIDFFSEFGNQRELLRIADLYYNTFKKGDIKKLSRAYVDGTPLEDVVKKYAVGENKNGERAKSYTLLDVKSVLHELEDWIKGLNLNDLSDRLKMSNFIDIMGYAGYFSGKEEDRRKLYITDFYPLKRRSDNKQFGYSVTTRSLGSGKEGRFTLSTGLFNIIPVMKGDIIYCKSFEKRNSYFWLTGYERLYS